MWQLFFVQIIVCLFLKITPTHFNPRLKRFVLLVVCSEDAGCWYSSQLCWGRYWNSARSLLLLYLLLVFLSILASFLFLFQFPFGFYFTLDLASLRGLTLLSYTYTMYICIFRMIVCVFVCLIQNAKITKLRTHWFRSFEGWLFIYRLEKLLFYNFIFIIIIIFFFFSFFKLFLQIILQIHEVV